MGLIDRFRGRTRRVSGGEQVDEAHLVEFIRTRCPGLTIRPGEATYLAWIDATALGVDNPALHFEKKAGLFLSDGAFFGWPGHFRFNFVCPRARVLEGLEKIAAAI